MLKVIAITLSLAATLAACGNRYNVISTNDVSRDSSVIKTEEAFRAYVAGRPLYLGDGNNLFIHQDGTISGVFGGEQMTGNWEWRRGYYCRTLASHSQDSDCQLFLLIENGVIGIRDRGQGAQFTYSYSPKEGDVSAG
ncbi:hypothetical protein ACFE33_11890 [Falsihalocynthiibacter sp. SS001]|uniref:hypothetical protein n=1 Tax=Falsihalocynthiibacter sp. SS001 TaxID=3349698 RepID=UPI0036D3C745